MLSIYEAEKAVLNGGKYDLSVVEAIPKTDEM